MFSHYRIIFYFKAISMLLLGLTALPSFAVETRSLDLNPDKSDYSVECIMLDRAPNGMQYHVSFVMCCLEGDGLPELVGGRNRKILGFDGEDGKIKPLWQLNIDPGFNLQQRTPVLGVVADFNNDAIGEIYTTIVSDDHSDWRFLAFDPATETITLNVPLPLGKDRRADGVWDGHYLALGSVQDADGKGRPGVVLLRNVEYDASLRGVVVIDPFTGEIIWDWECGPNPDVESPLVADLDGDGNNEIIIFGTSPDNLGGVKVNGTSDNQSLIFVLDSRGNLLWQGEIGPTFTAGSYRTADLDRDGVLEIITFTRGAPVNHTNKLMVWDGLTGNLITQTRGSAGILGVAFTEGPRPGTSWVFAGSDDGVIDRFLFEGTTLVRDRRIIRDEPHCRVIGAVDILPEEGPEIVVDIGRGALLGVLDRDLKPLAACAENSYDSKRILSLWHTQAGETALVLGNQQANWVLQFHKVPTNYLSMIQNVGFVLMVLVAGAGIFLLGQRKGRREGIPRHAVPTGPRAADREVRYRLWRQLDDIKHEKMLEASRGLRRLVWLLDAYATGMGASEDLTERIRQLMRDYSEVVKPRLEGILQLARGEQFENEIVDATTGALDSLTQRLKGLTTQSMNVTKVSDGRGEMKKELQEVEEGLFGLWESLRDYFSTDPVRMLKGMLLVREGEFSRSQIEADIVGAEKIPDAGCLIDSSDLRYVLGNLIDNAARAMDENENRRLLLQIERSNSEISLHVSDTGGGISPEIRERIFSGRFSTRHGGGNGLFRSREILRRWGGEIILAESTLGKGTTFIVRLRAARKPENGMAQEAKA